MAKTLDEILEIKESLELTYQQRHAALRLLRNYWWGRHWEQAEQSSRSVISMFRDIKGNQSDVGPDIKVVHNIIQQICVKYQSFLSPLPQIHVYTDPPSTETRKAQAARKQRFLYGAWSAGRMDKRFNNIAWYLPLMGSCYLGIHPDFDRKLPLPLVRSAEYAYPIPGYNGDEDGVIFCWSVPVDAVKRAYPNYEVESGGGKSLFGFGKSGSNMVDLVEYSDKYEFSRWAGTQKLAGVEHNYGFNLWDHLKFIDVPDEAFGHGAVEQVVTLNEAEDVLYSLILQSAIDHVFPKLVLIDPSKAPEELDMGPGSALGVNAGGDAKYLVPPVQALGIQTAFLNQHGQHIKEAAGLSDPNFGNSPVSSRVTGAAIDELLGAGAGTTIEMVQGTFGSDISRWNEKAIYIAQEMFKGDNIMVYGTEVNPMSLNPRRFSDSFKGSQLIGSSRNDVIFSPALNQHEKLVMWLQGLGGRLVSKGYVRNQIGIPDSEAMVEEIFSETIEEAVLGALAQEIQAQPNPQQLDTVEQQGYALLQGLTNPPAVARASAPMPSPSPAPGGGGPGGPPVGPIAPGAPGQAISPALALPPGSPPPGQAPPGAAPSAPNPPQGNGVKLPDVVQALSGVQFSGRVYLVGEIVQQGQTSGDIEFALTDQSDQSAVQQALPQYAAQLVFHIVKGKPSEPSVEVGQGVKTVYPNQQQEAQVA